MDMATMGDKAKLAAFICSVFLVSSMGFSEPAPQKPGSLQENERPRPRPQCNFPRPTAEQRQQILLKLKRGQIQTSLYPEVLKPNSKAKSEGATSPK